MTSLADYSLRRSRPILNCSEPIITDQSQTPMTEMNNIILQYTRTGMLPNLSNHQMAYVDDTTAPDFMSAHNQMVFAKEQFQKLPLSLRNELNHDYRQFESWLSNPDNLDRAEKLGLITKRKPVKSPTIKADTNETKNEKQANGTTDSDKNAQQS